MPAKNIVKPYLENTHYHIYNRGVEKRDIFLDEQDCKVFLHYLKLYLSPPEDLLKETVPSEMRIRRFIRHNLSKEVDLLSFALMPNHIHLHIKQYTKDGIVKLMQRLSTSYVMYFNKKYQRVGSLFQNTYKATIIDHEPYLLHLSRYIHLNPIEVKHSTLVFANFSSYPYYLGHKTASWIKPQEILNYFRTAMNKNSRDLLSYQSFVEDYGYDSAETLGELTLED